MPQPRRVGAPLRRPRRVGAPLRPPRRVGPAAPAAARWRPAAPAALAKEAAGLVVSRVCAAGIEEDEKDMRKCVTRGRPDAKARKLMAASSMAQPPGVMKTLTAVVLPPDAPLPRPPLTEKDLCWLNAADKMRKRPVKKRRDKKLTVTQSEAEAEAEAAGSSKRRVPRARKNKDKK
eukprot:jgi/Tetstr1/463332/TSEL_008256.t1